MTKYDSCLGDGLTAYRKHNSCETTYWPGRGLETGKRQSSASGNIINRYVQSFLKVTSTAYAAQIKSLLFPGQSTGFSVQLPMQPLRESAHRVGN